MAAETVAWFAFGGTREDWRLPLCSRYAPRGDFVWLTEWAWTWRRMFAPGVRHGR